MFTPLKFPHTADKIVDDTLAQIEDRVRQKEKDKRKYQKRVDKEYQKLTKIPPSNLETYYCALREARKSSRVTQYFIRITQWVTGTVGIFYSLNYLLLRSENGHGRRHRVLFHMIPFAGIILTGSYFKTYHQFLENKLDIKLDACSKYRADRQVPFP